MGVTVAELLSKLDEAYAELASAQPIIATDGDGTLWRGDIGEALFEAALADEVLLPAVQPALRAEAERHGVDGAGDSHQLARRLLRAFEGGAYPEEHAFAMMAWVFAGWPLERMRAYCDTVLDRFGFEAARRPAAVAVLAWAAERDVPVWLVSASQQQLVSCAAARLGLSEERVAAMDPNQQDGVLAPGLRAAATYAAGKVVRLRACTQQPVLAAFGDSGFDAALLELAQLPVAVAPNQALRERVAGWPQALIVDGER